MTTNKEETAIDFIVAMQAKQGTSVDEANVRTALAKPLLLDNIGPKLTLSQLNKKKEERQIANRRRHLLPRSQRRVKLQPIASVALERELFRIWSEHHGMNGQNEVKLSRGLDLHGCELQVISSNRHVGRSGVVIGETKDAIHLSNRTEGRVFTIKKRKTVFACGDVLFQRYYG